MEMFIYPIDEEVTLKVLNRKDADILFPLINKSRSYLRQALPWIDDVRTKQDMIQFIQSGFSIYAAGKGITAGIFYNHDLVGEISFNHLDFVNRIGYIGYWLGEMYQGKGIMTRSVKGFINYGFTELNLERIDIRMDPNNKKSQAIAERLGFSFEGRIRQAEWLYDHYVDHLVFGLLKAEWGD